VAPESGDLNWQPMSLAEIMRGAGIFVDVGPEATAREHELLLERILLDNTLSRYALAREIDSARHWTFVASDPMDAEEVDSSRAQHITLYTVFC